MTWIVALLVGVGAMGGPSLPHPSTDALQQHPNPPSPRETTREATESTETEAVEPAGVAGVALCDAACVDCESGGDPQAVNPAGYWGWYQFDYGTWVAHGGDPNSYGVASGAEQTAVAARIQYDAWPNC